MPLRLVMIIEAIGRALRGEARVKARAGDKTHQSRTHLHPMQMEGIGLVFSDEAVAERKIRKCQMRHPEMPLHLSAEVAPDGVVKAKAEEKIGAGAGEKIGAGAGKRTGAGAKEKKRRRTIDVVKAEVGGEAVAAGEAKATVGEGKGEVRGAVPLRACVDLF